MLQKMLAPNSPVAPPANWHFLHVPQLILETLPGIRSSSDHPHVTEEETNTEQKDSSHTATERQREARALTAGLTVALGTGGVGGTPAAGIPISPVSWVTTPTTTLRLRSGGFNK